MKRKKDFKPRQLEYFVIFTDRILENINLEESINTKLKFDTTPKEKRKKLCLKELKKCRNKFLKYSIGLREIIQEHISEYVESYEVNIKVIPIDESSYEHIFDNLEDWMPGFLSSFVKNLSIEDQLSYYNFNFGYYIREELDDLGDGGQYLIPENYLSDLPKIEELIQILHTLEYFKWLWAAYNSFLEGKIFDINRNWSRRLRGFNSNLDSIKLKKLFDLLVYKQYISNETKFEHFRKIFSNELLSQGIKIEWIDTSPTRHEPNKQTLFELFYLLKEYKYLDSKDFDTKASNPNNFYKMLERIFPNIKNFSASNPQSSQKKTPRQIELEEIIITLKS